MKIVLISDTHQLHRLIPVPEGDLLIHAGDWTNQGSTEKMKDFLTWFSEQPHKQKVFISGNHELGLDQGPMRGIKINIIRDFLNKNPNLTYLENSSTIINGLKFYGSPHTPWYHNWAWNLDRGEKIAEAWKHIPNDTEILITHGPPHGILDLVANPDGRDPHQGCEELIKKVKTLSKLKLHVFGHLHHNGGQITTVDNVIFANGAICDDRHSPVRTGLVIDL